ncbi:MAG: hypothetical protein ACKVT1_01250 [Dehalococcoidia bacterium]
MATNLVHVHIEDTTTALLTYTSFRLYRGTAPDGTFSLVTTVAIVDGTENYTYSDTGGAGRSWYRVSYYTASGPLESSMGPPFQAVGVTLRDLRVDAAIKAGAGFRGTATGGTSTTLVDSNLLDQGVDSDFLEGIWIYRPDAALASDKVRRVSEAGFDPATGALSVGRAYTNAPVASEEYHCFALMPPIPQVGMAYSWDMAVRDALERIAFVDQIDLGPGDGESNRFSLAHHIGQVSARNIRRAYLRWFDTHGLSHDQDLNRNGLSWNTEENGPEALYLRLNIVPSTSDFVIVEALVTDAALYIDADTTRTPVDRALDGIVARAFEMMETIQPGRYSGEMAMALARAASREQRSAAPRRVVL